MKAILLTVLGTMLIGVTPSSASTDYRNEITLVEAIFSETTPEEKAEAVIKYSTLVPREAIPARISGALVAMNLVDARYQQDLIKGLTSVANLNQESLHSVGGRESLLQEISSRMPKIPEPTGSLFSGRVNCIASVVLLSGVTGYAIYKVIEATEVTVGAPVIALAGLFVAYTTRDVCNW